MARDDLQPGLRYHLKVLSFRTLTVVLAWVFLAVAFYDDPELLTGAQRLIQRAIAPLARPIIVIVDILRSNGDARAIAGVFVVSEALGDKTRCRSPRTNKPAITSSDPNTKPTIAA